MRSWRFFSTSFCSLRRKMSTHWISYIKNTTTAYNIGIPELRIKAAARSSIATFLFLISHAFLGWIFFGTTPSPPKGKKMRRREENIVNEWPQRKEICRAKLLHKFLWCCMNINWAFWWNAVSFGFLVHNSSQFEISTKKISSQVTRMSMKLFRKW